MNPACPPHHWMLPPPNGTRMIVGRCKFCGARRDHLAYQEDTYKGFKLDPRDAGKREWLEAAAV